MTVKELLEIGGISYTRKNCSKIGLEISKLAKTKGITFDKKEEVIMVNDYPDSFIPEMEGVVIEVLKRSVQNG